MNSQIALVHYLARDFDEAERFALKSLEINPHHEPAHFVLGLAHQLRGISDGARVELEKAYAISKGEPHVESALAMLEVIDGNSDRAQQRLQKLHELASVRHVSPVHFALAHAALGRVDEAFRDLEAAIEIRSGWLVYLATEPRFDALRNDARFDEVLMAVGLRV
jgi:serine/threonine-protein kinase